MKIVVIGGSAAGLFSGLLLARDGHDVTVVERDDLTPAADVAAAAEGAFRATAPQIVQPHGVLSLCLELLRGHLPDVVTAIPAAGIVELDFAGQLPPGLVADNRPGDERLATLRTRRSTFDWVIRRAAAAQARIGHVQTVARGVVSDRARSDVPIVTGVATDRGILPADLVVDASGRSGGIDRRLQALGSRPAPVMNAECGLAYYSRHYRLRTSVGLPGPPTTRVLAELNEFTAGIWAGDNATMLLAIAPLVEDRRFRAVADPAIHTSVLRLVGPLAPWLDVLEPTSGVFPMGGLHNTYRRLVDGNGPIIGGLVCVGDTVCCTNPTLGRGLSLALQNAVDLVEILRRTEGEPLKTVLEMDGACESNTAPFYVDQARIDEARLAFLRANHAGAQPPPVSSDPTRVSLAELRAAAPFNADVFRAVVTLTGMLVRPDDIYADPEIVAAVRSTLRDAPPGGPIPQPSTEELDRVLAA